jgi:bifunctional non-homologous end joining protein LigD
VFIPLGPHVPYATAKVLLELIGRLLQARHHDIATMERRISERGGRLYIDTGQTGRSRTIVAPYSVRAHTGATVSTPLDWDEVHLALSPSDHTIFTVPERVRASGDAAAKMLDERPDVAHAVGRLQALFGL